MKSLQELLPRASKSFLEANSAILTPETKKNDASDLTGTPRRGVMNKTEQEFSLILEAMKQKGEILRWEFEGITLRFANVKYTPDFFVVIAQSSQSDTGESWGEWYQYKFIEVKGPFIKGNRERAVERFRHAKTYWPELTFELHQKTRDGWRQLL